MPTLLAIIPHPDDESYSFGGTIALAARAGWRCLVECVTYGERGERHDGGPTDTNAVADVREAELEASCKALWTEPPNFWGLPDGSLRLHRGETSRIHRLFHDLAPALVLTLGRDGVYGHPDHVALHNWVRAAWESFDGARPALLFPAFPRGLFLPQHERCANMMGSPPDPPAAAIGSDSYDYEVDIHTVARVKQRSIAAHFSQLPGGDPQALFPPGIVARLMTTERFSDASGGFRPKTAEVVRSLQPGLTGSG